MIQRKWVGYSGPIRLGILRVLAVFPALLYVLWENYPTFAEVPFSWYRPLGFMMFIPQDLTEKIMTSALLLFLYKSFLVILLVSAMAGLMTRWSLALGTLLYFFYIGSVRGYAWFFHTGLLPFFLMFIMLWLPVGDGFSIDSWLKRKKNDEKIPTDQTYAWCVFLLRAVLAFSYFQAGYAKLHNSGLVWLEPWVLKKHVIQDSLTLMHFDFDWGLKAMYLPDSFWAVTAALAVFSELFYPVVLVSWKLRQIYPVIGMGLHTAILLMQNILFPDLIILQLMFYDWDRIFRLEKVSPQDRRYKPQRRKPALKAA